MIKNYLEFIKESGEEFNSIGEWVESLINDDYVKNIVTRYTKDSDPSIDLSNAINVLDERVKADIKQQIDNYLENGIQEKEPQVITTGHLESITESEEITISGKGIFTSFLKCLTSLGQKESKPNWEKCPDNFILFYYYPSLNSETVKQVFSRFKSLFRYVDYIDYAKNEVDLYFGVKCDGQFEYGIVYDEFIPLGQFKASLSAIRWICKIESKSAASLKKEVVNLSYLDILTLGKIKIDMKDYNPGYHEKRLPATLSEDKVLSFGYHGLGVWNNGKLDDNDYINVKNNFNNWVIGKKWGSKVLISVKAESFWLHLHIKLK